MVKVMKLFQSFFLHFKSLCINVIKWDITIFITFVLFYQIFYQFSLKLIKKAKKSANKETLTAQKDKIISRLPAVKICRDIYDEVFQQAVVINKNYYCFTFWFFMRILEISNVGKTNRNKINININKKRED